jgi:plasmid stability protein
VEDEVRRLRRRVAEGESLPADEVAAVRDRLREMQLSTEEWNAIRRLIYRLQLERARAAAPEDALEPIR